MVSGSVSLGELSGRQNVITGMRGENMQLQMLRRLFVHFSACVLWKRVDLSLLPSGGKFIYSSIEV